MRWDFSSIPIGELSFVNMLPQITNQPFSQKFPYRSS